VLLQDGNTTVKPLTLSVVGGGEIMGEMGIDARTDDPTVKANLEIGDIEFGNPFRESRCFDAILGTALDRSPRTSSRRWAGPTGRIGATRQHEKPRSFPGTGPYRVATPAAHPSTSVVARRKEGGRRHRRRVIRLRP